MRKAYISSVYNITIKNILRIGIKRGGEGKGRERDEDY